MTRRIGSLADARFARSGASFTVRRLQPPMRSHLPRRKIVNARSLPRDETGVTGLRFQELESGNGEGPSLLSCAGSLTAQGHSDFFIYASSCPAGRCERPRASKIRRRVAEKRATNKKERKDVRQSYRSSPIRDIGILDPRYRARLTLGTLRSQTGLGVFRVK